MQHSLSTNRIHLKILLLEPYFTGSHAAWAESYASFSGHDVTIFSLDGRFWKWRMHGGAVTLARRFMKEKPAIDLILASDMLDLTTFLSLTRSETAGIPAVVYFHENQLTYPWSSTDRDLRSGRDGHYGFINFVSALAADAICFNSGFHKSSFLEALKVYLGRFPDNRELRSVEKIAARSQVLPLGLDLARFDAYRPPADESPEQAPGAADLSKPPLILWNHRWEYDKNPGDFFRALEILAARGLDFELAVLGENFSEKPVEFLDAKRKLGGRIIHFGYAADFAEYAILLWRADLLPVTSNQDFFGASIVEAVYCGCCPLLPDRLSYPELLPPGRHGERLYGTFDELLEKLAFAIEHPGELETEDCREAAARFDWSRLAPEYDGLFSRIAADCRGG